jgi:hypothetical protein
MRGPAIKSIRQLEPTLLLHPKDWPSVTLRLISELSTVPVPRTSSALQSVFKTQVTLFDIAGSIFSSVYRAHRQLEHASRTAYTGLTLAWASLELWLGVPLLGSLNWDTEGYAGDVRSRLRCLETFLEWTQDLWSMRLDINCKCPVQYLALRPVVHTLPSFPALLSQPTSLYLPFPAIGRPHSPDASDSPGTSDEDANEHEQIEDFDMLQDQISLEIKDMDRSEGHVSRPRPVLDTGYADVRRPTYPL